MPPTWSKADPSAPTLSITLRYLPSEASDNSDHHLQDDKPKASSVDKQVLAKEFTKHHGVLLHCGKKKDKEVKFK